MMASTGTAKGAPNSPATVSSSIGFPSRRDSSVSASSMIDREQLAIALDKIHTAASQSDVLTTFNDFAPPPGTALATESKGTTGDLVQQGLSGLYSRFREAVGAGKVPNEVDEDNQDAVSRKSVNTVNTGSRASIASMPRGDSGVADLSFKTSQQDLRASMTSSTAVQGSQSQMPQSSKASSLNTLNTSKSAFSSAQSLSKIVKAGLPTPANATVDPVTVSSRGLTTRVEEEADQLADRTSRNTSEALPATNISTTSSIDSMAMADRMRVPSRARRDGGLSADGSMDAQLSPVKGSSVGRTSSVGSRVTSGETMRRPAVIDRISFSREGNRSRSSSIEPGVATPSTINTSAHNVIHHSSFAHNERPQRLQSGAMRIPGTTTNQGAPEVVNARLESMRKQILSKEFWMADDTCKECFLCGSPFSAFRRKHHCRTCGCIFDSKCTQIISGQKFGVQGTLRVCKKCIDIINRRYDSGSDDSADESYLPVFFRPGHVSRSKADDEASIAERSEHPNSSRTGTTPMMAIPATRRPGETHGNSAILEIDMPQLSRPSSARSLKSMTTGRPQSSGHGHGHRRLHSKQNFLARLKTSAEERAPFRNSANEELRRKSKLPAFHDDNIIDPDLAPYMSDESTGDEQMSIFSTLASDMQPSSLDPDRSNFGPFINAGRKHKFRQGEKSISGLSVTSRGHEDALVHPNISLHSRPGRRRNLSVASANMHHLRSPRPKSGIYKSGMASTEALLQFDTTGAFEGTSLRRSDSNREDEESSREKIDPASLAHVKKLFRQMLTDADVANAAAWEKSLIPILTRCADDVELDVRRGDDMDIRHFVKFKKIVGGRPSDSTYVSGIVFTKNLALKNMARKIFNEPRIVLVSFAIEYQRYPEQHFMSLQPVIEQEKEYLRMVVSRIVALRPQILLVEKSVAGVALQLLSEANIAVAYNVKPSVIEAVSRIANTDIISSLDMLALPIRVGVSKSFEVKTYVNGETKPAQKKTYMFISGTNRKLGCTIALRGGSTQLLHRMKRITEFMIYVVYNVKLETCLLRDSFVHMPEDGIARSTSKSDHAVVETTQFSDIVTISQSSVTDTCTQFTDNAVPCSETVQATEPSQPFFDEKKMVSVHESHSRAAQDSQDQVPEDVPMPTYYSDMVAKYETRVLSASPLVKFSQPYLLMRARAQERRVLYLKRLRDQDIMEENEESEKPRAVPFQLIKPEMVLQIGHKAPRPMMEVLHAVHDAEYDKALHNYRTQTRQWETNIQDSLDLFDPMSHQNIVVLYSEVCTATKIPCIEPSLVTIEYYNQYADEHVDSDCTLGQYIENLCQGAESVCTVNGCYTPLCNHHRTYVHDQARITVFVERGTPVPPKFQAAKADADKHGSIIMWSFCKFCKDDFGGSAMSQSTWKYSFGKFLELSFLGQGMMLRPGSGCSHNHPRDHLRYFAFGDNMVRIHWDAIELYEIIVPRARITWKVTKDLQLKNEIFTKAEDRWKRFMESVKGRLKSIKVETSVLPEKAESCKEEVDRLQQKVQEDLPKLIRDLQDAYMNSKYYEAVPMNAVVRRMLEKAAEWDAAFAKFEADFLSDKDVRQLALIQLKKFFTDDESKDSLPANDGQEDKTPARSQSDSEEKLTSQGGSQPSEADNMGHAAVSCPAAVEEAPKDEVATAAPELTLDTVEPLDLARPRSAVDGVLPSSDQALHPVSPTAGAAPQTEDLTLSEKVERLRREQRIASGESSGGETVGESSTETQRAGPSRRAGLVVSPPMMRAVTQPALPRLQSGIAKLGKESKAADKAGDMLQRGTDPIKGSTDKVKFPERIVGALKSHRKPGPSSIPRYVHSGSKKKETKVSTLARHFELLSREFEKERIRDRKNRAAKLQGSRAFLPRASTKAIVEVYEDVDQAVQEPGPSDDDHLADRDQQQQQQKGEETASQPSLGLQTSKASHGAEGAEEEEEDAKTETESPSKEDVARDVEADGEGGGVGDEAPQESRAASDDGCSDVDQSSLTFEEALSDVKEMAESLEPSGEMPEELPKHQKKSVMNLLTNFWAERSASNWPSLDYPLNATDHIFVDSDVIIREDEPSSVIAYTLSSEDYEGKLATIRRQWGSAGVDEAELERSLVRPTSTHMRYQFFDRSAKMLCKVFYAEQFEALRQKCGVADRVVECLSRCLKWDSKGGKTKSVFLKTLDDRLVMKSLSPVETSAFLEFAPAYFSLMAEALFHDLPSVIAKMLGFFQVVIKNPDTNVEIKLDLLVMENLFYDLSPSRTFDLKGSMRNRKIQSTGEQNEVLLDENMVEYIYESPLFAREHSKRLLRASVWNDTLFLARQDVMDYSLMVAVDEDRRELVVGVIDCIRTYTWDKRLESWIKDRGFAGGGRNRPTVTSPKEYKSRFREAMARYILQSPNCWHPFRNPHNKSPGTPRTHFEGDV